MRQPYTRKEQHTLTRNDFALTDIERVQAGDTIRCRECKYKVMDYMGEDAEHFTRHEFAKTREVDLPDEVVIKYKRTPVFYLERQ